MQANRQNERGGQEISQAAATVGGLPSFRTPLLIALVVACSADAGAYAFTQSIIASVAAYVLTGMVVLVLSAIVRCRNN